MALLSTHIQQRPGIIHAVVELLLAAGGPLSTVEIEHLLRPDVLTERDSLGDDDVRSPTLVSDALDLCRQLGVVVGSDSVRLDDETARCDVRRMHKSLPDIVRRRMLSSRGVTDSGNDRVMWADLLDSLSWLLAQNPFGQPLTNERLMLLRHEQLGATNETYFNSTKRPVLVEWGRYLGVLATDPIAADQLVPDPSNAVLSVLRSSMDVEMSIVDVVELLADKLCVVDGGTARRAIRHHLSVEHFEWEHDEGAVSPSLSLALYRLDRNGSIRLDQVADTTVDRRRRLRLDDQRVERVVDVVAPGPMFGAKGEGS